MAAALLPKSRPLISTKPITDETGSPAAVHRSCDLYETQWVAPTGAEHELHLRPSAAWLPVLRLTSSCRRVYRLNSGPDLEGSSTENRSWIGLVKNANVSRHRSPTTEC